MPDEALQDECLKRYVHGAAVRVRMHGVAFPGATAIGGGPPRKKARAQQKKRSAAALPGIAPQPKRAGRGWRKRLPAAAPTREGSVGPVTEAELEPYLKMRAFPCAREGSVIRVGSECSGLDSVVTALEFVHDKGPRCHELLIAVHKPRRVGGDVQGRSVENIEDMRVVDLYTAGFPCQPWSPEGKGERAARTSRGAAGFSTMSRRASS